MLTKPPISSSVIHEQTIPTAQRSPPTRLSSTTLWIICLGILLGGVVVIGWRWLLPKPIEHGVVLQSPQRATNFVLTAHTGEVVQLNDFRGEYVLLNFGYTFCPDVCPLTLSTLSQAVNLLNEEKQNAQVLFVSVDPERDTAERLSRYVPNFHASFIGLTGSEDEIQAAATQFGVYFARSQSESTSALTTTGYLVDHTATVLVLDPEGYLRVLFPYGVTSAEMASDLSSLMN